jgi:hypothetical protein
LLGVPGVLVATSRNNFFFVPGEVLFFLKQGVVNTNLQRDEFLFLVSCAACLWPDPLEARALIFPLYASSVDERELSKFFCGTLPDDSELDEESQI